MSGPQIEFYFDFPSPYSYMASTALPKLAAKHGATVAYRPFRILKLMEMVGNTPTTITCKAKNRYAQADLGRWQRRYGVTLQRNPKMGTFDFTLLGRLVLVANAQDRGRACVDAIFPAVWAGTDDLADIAVLARRLDAAGFAGATMIEQAAGSTWMAQLDEATAKAAERGVFGAPTFFLGNDMFFGNDRLDFVAEALGANRRVA